MKLRALLCFTGPHLAATMAAAHGHGGNQAMAKDPRGKPLMIRSGDQIYIPPNCPVGFILEFPQGAPKAFGRPTNAPERDCWYERSPNDPAIICLTSRERSA